MNGVPLRVGLLATGPLREMHRATDAAIEFAHDLARAVGLRVSAASIMVLTIECRDSTERELLALLLEYGTVYHVSAAVSRRALALLESLPAPAALPFNDALVAATALTNKIPLYTLDPARFAAVTGLTALRPY